jgi:hypothetical protein
LKSVSNESLAVRLVVMASTATVLASGSAAAAVRTSIFACNPCAALSAFSVTAATQALCGAAASSAVSSAVQAGTPGCVFPAVHATVSAPVGETAPLATPAATVAGAGVGIFPLLAGLAAVGGAAAPLLSNDNSQTQISVSP